MVIVRSDWQRGASPGWRLRCETESVRRWALRSERVMLGVRDGDETPHHADAVHL